MVISAFGVAVLAAMAKFLEDSPSSQMLLFQMLVATIVFGAPLVRGTPKSFETRRVALHLGRGVLALASWYAYLLAIDDIPVLDGTLLSNTVPLWVPLIVWAMTRERPPLALLGGIAVGTVGVVLVLQPSRGPEVQPGTLLALASGILGAMSFVAAGSL